MKKILSISIILLLSLSCFAQRSNYNISNDKNYHSSSLKAPQIGAICNIIDEKANYPYKILVVDVAATDIGASDDTTAYILLAAKANTTYAPVSITITKGTSNVAIGEGYSLRLAYSRIPAEVPLKTALLDDTFGVLTCHAFKNTPIQAFNQPEISELKINSSVVLQHEEVGAGSSDAVFHIVLFYLEIAN